MSQFLKSGVSTIDISPVQGIELVGYPHYSRKNTGVHDPLLASCMFLDNGEARLVVVTLDILFVSKSFVGKVRNRIFEKTGIPKENIMLCCSHTHSGPSATELINIDILKIEKPDGNYVYELENKIVSLVASAVDNTFDARIGVGRGVCGKEHGVGGNRREPDGPADPEVCVIGVQDMEGKWRACFVKYAVHPTVMHAESTVITADYPCYIRNYLTNIMPDMTLLFAQGTSGNQSTRYFRNGQTFEEACRIGTTIGIVTSEVLSSMKLSSDVKLEVETSEVDLDMRALPGLEEAEADVLKAGKKLEKLKQENASYIETQTADLVLLGAENILAYAKMDMNGDIKKFFKAEMPAEIQVIGINDSRMVCLQGEIFVEYGLEIKERSPFADTFVVELANGSLPGYMCTEEAYKSGGYEAGASLLDSRAGRSVVEAVLKLLDKKNRTER